MKKQSKKPEVVRMRKLKHEPETNLPVVSRAKLDKLVAEAVVDAYDEDEHTMGFLNMIQEYLVVPFSTTVLGIEVITEEIEMTQAGQIVAVCRRDKFRQRIGILDLPLPKPAPVGAEWIAAYYYWRGGFR